MRINLLTAADHSALLVTSNLQHCKNVQHLLAATISTLPKTEQNVVINIHLAFIPTSYHFNKAQFARVLNAKIIALDSEKKDESLPFRRFREVRASTISKNDVLTLILIPETSPNQIPHTPYSRSFIKRLIAYFKDSPAKSVPLKIPLEEIPVSYQVRPEQVKFNFKKLNEVLYGVHRNISIKQQENNWIITQINK